MVSIRDRVKQLVPTQVTTRVKESLVDYGVRTSDRRPLPDFLIIGTKRGGTTSLWNYLIQHPLVPRLFPAWNTKSAHYFEEHWGRGEVLVPLALPDRAAARGPGQAARRAGPGR